MPARETPQESGCKGQDEITVSVQKRAIQNKLPNPRYYITMLLQVLVQGCSELVLEDRAVCSCHPKR